MPNNKVKKLGQLDLLPLEEFTKPIDPLSVVTAGSEFIGEGGESMLQALGRRTKEFFNVPEPIPIGTPIDTSLFRQTPGETQFGIAEGRRDIVLPDVNNKATDLVSALNPVKQETRTPLPTTTPTTLATPQSNEEVLVERAQGGGLSGLVSNPNFIRFLAELGSGIGGEGSVGEGLGQAAIGIQQSKIYNEALRLSLAGEDTSALPLHLLSVEQQNAIKQQTLIDVKTKAEIAEAESRIRTADLTVSEQIAARGAEARKTELAKPATIQKVLDTATDVADEIIKRSEADLGRSEKGILVGKSDVSPEYEKISQENFINGIESFPKGTAITQVSRFFTPYIPGETKVGDKFYTADGIYELTETDGTISGQLIKAF